MKTILTNNFSERQHPIAGVIIHFTAGGDIDGTVKWFKNIKSGCSAHYVISRSGNIVRMVPEDEAAWHAGSKTTRPSLNGLHNLNSRTIGIELCNWGWLHVASKNEECEYLGKKYQRTEGLVYTRLKNWTNEFFGPRETHEITSDILSAKRYPFPGGNTCYYWESYNGVQIQALIDLLNEIVGRYPNITRDWVAGHSHVDPDRKLDPGPAFPFETVLNAVFHTEKEVKGYTVAPSYRVREIDMEHMYESRRSIPGCKK